MKVAAYCRVSTDQEDQANSFESQRRYFREYIERQPDWELVEIYADEGITGTSTEKRTAFNRMLRDARLHRFDLIVTKEISRFARNTLDSIRYTRELKKMGIGVLFLNDGMNTLQESSEFILTIKASQAQEESRATSSRVKWGQTRRMEQGVVFGRSLLGYDVKDGKLTVNPAGAEIVRLIYHKYVQERKGTTTIARELREAGFKTLRGGTDWRATVILKILCNEKYCGDLKQKKTYTPDYLTHQKKYNHGEEPFVYLRDHHEPIIDRALWEEAQREIRRRDRDGKLASGHGNRYPLSGKIKCAACGKSFVSRGRKRRDGTVYRTWRCGTAVAQGKRRVNAAGIESGCEVGYQLRDEAGMAMLRQAVGMLRMDNVAIVSNLTGLVLSALQASEDNRQNCLDTWDKKLTALREKKKRVLDAYFEKEITSQDMHLMNEEYDREIDRLSEQIKLAEGESQPSPWSEGEIRAKICGIVSGREAPDAFYGNLLDHITAYPDRKLELCLKQLPQSWLFRLERQGEIMLRNDPSVPMSVSNPFSSSKGIE